MKPGTQCIHSSHFHIAAPRVVGREGSQEKNADWANCSAEDYVVASLLIDAG